MIDAKILVAGAQGMVGSAIVRALQRSGCPQVLAPSRRELDLLDGAAVKKYLEAQRPAQIYVAAAKVGGILANDSYPANFLYDNLMIEANLIHGAFESQVSKLLFLGSTCIYPKLAPQPLKEEYLLSGPLEPTNEWYAVAKIAGIKLCQAYRKQYGCDFISVMPTNLYGPNDNYDPQGSHVLPAMIRRFHEAKQKDLPEVVCWGTGSPLREFLHSDDLASACVLLLQRYSDDQFINAGSGQEISIKDLATVVARAIGYRGQIRWDTSKPDGTPRKVMDSAKLTTLGWQPHIAMETGIAEAYADFLKKIENNAFRSGV